MRFLGIGEYCDLGDMYYRLQQRGHDVKVFIEMPQAHDIFGGMIQRIDDWRSELQWIKEAGKQGIIIFESAIKGAIQDQLRREGFQVIGGSEFGDRLEGNRDFGQQILRSIGMQTAPSFSFDSFSAAVDFVKSSPARYVYKSNGANALRTRNYIGELESGADIIALLCLHEAQWCQPGKPDFVLMEHVQGIEVGIGAYFNGHSFLKPACMDWEHKRLFPGNMGELTGEMGTIVTYRGAETLFEQSLARMESALREGGYCGYINLNMIANAQGLWPLEFTSRFGYPGYAICEALHKEPWESIFHKLLGRNADSIETSDGFSAGVVMTVPPFPYSYGYEELSKGMPISFTEDLTYTESHLLHWAEVARREDQLITSGMIGYIGVTTGVGDTLKTAVTNAYQLIRKIVVPNLRYRNDIGTRLIQNDWNALVKLGFIKAQSST